MPIPSDDEVATEGSQPLQVTVSVPGTFWVSRIARAIESRGGTVTIYTSASPSEFDSTSAENLVHSIRYPGYIKKLGYLLSDGGTLAGLTRWNRPMVRWGDYLFDRTVARRLPTDAADLFLGFAGASRDSIYRANDLGLTTVVERASSHIRTQRRLLVEEYERHGVEGQPISMWHVKREEAEYREADFVVTPSAFTEHSFVEEGVPVSKIYRIPFGMDVDFEPPDRSERDGSFRVLFAGRASLRKGIQYLLPAWASLDLPDAELVIAGRVDDAVRDFVTDYADGSVRLLGWVDDIETQYREASVLVLPSIEEGSARVTYEAMAWGLPVVTTPHSGWVGTDQEHGLEVPIRDPNALATALRRLYDEPSTRRRFGRNGRELVERKYTWEDYGYRVYTAYRSMLAE